MTVQTKTLTYMSCILGLAVILALPSRKTSRQLDRQSLYRPAEIQNKIPREGKHYLLCAFLHYYDLSEYLESVEYLKLAEARFYIA